MEIQKYQTTQIISKLDVRYGNNKNVGTLRINVSRDMTVENFFEAMSWMLSLTKYEQVHENI